MAEEYKISLGVKLDTSDIQNQVNAASNNIKPIELKIDAETKELTNTIKKALNNLSKGTKNALTLDTSKLESSLNDVTSTIREIKMAIGSLDNGSGMQSLVGSINSISIALDKASNKFDGLLADLKSLSGKDFNLNFGINLGGSNSVARQGVYGNKVRSETLPQLQQQVNDLVKYYNDTYKTSFNKFETLQKMVSGTKLNNGDFFENFLFGKDSVASRMGSGSLSSQMQAYKAYIDMFKQAASLKGVDLSSVTSGFSKSADELIKDAQDIQTGAKEMEDSYDKLKQIFGGGNNLNVEGLSVSLEPIVKDLTAIREAVESLSKGVSVDGLTQSFDRLSDTLEKLMTNAKLVQDVLGNVGSGVNTGMSDVGVDKISQGQKELAQTSTSATNTVIQGEERKQQAYRETSGVIENLKTTLETMSVNRSSIDAVIKDMEELGFTATSTSVRLQNDGFNITVKGVDSIGRAITEIRHLDNETDEISLVGRKITQSLTEADKFVKQQKNTVADLTNQINQLNRAATDQNANRPIKDSAHLDSLQSKYQEIIAAIQKMGNASSATFDDERNEVKRLINEYKSLKSEFKNAENVSMDFKGADFASGLEIAKNRLREFKADAKGFHQVAQTVEQLDKAIEGVGDKSSLDKFNDQLRVAKSELKAVKSEVLSNNDNLANKIRIDIETDKFENKVSQLHTQLNQLTDVDGSLYNLRASIKQVDDAYDAMIKATDDESLIQAQKRFAAAIEKANNELKIQTREQRAANNAAKLADSKTALKADMLNWLKKNSKATKEYKAEIDRLIASLNKLDQAGVNGVRRQFNNIDRDAELKGLKGLNFLDSMKSKIKEYSVYFGAAELFMYAEQGLRSMFEQVKLIDSAMTELKKVTDETDATYERFLTNAADRAKAIGTTIDGLVSSTADFARLGYGFKDAQGLAEVANIYAVVGDEIDGVEGATESLISTMAAFKDEMNGMSNTDFAMSIIDKFNEIGKLIA